MILRIIFSLGSKESVKRMVEFLGTSLNKVYTFTAEGGEVMVGFGPNVARAPTIDDAWKVALWIKNNCRLNPKFVIEGRDDGKLVYVSTCELCREGKHEHEERKS